MKGNLENIKIKVNTNTNINNLISKAIMAKVTIIKEIMASKIMVITIKEGRIIEIMLINLSKISKELIIFMSLLLLKKFNNIFKVSNQTLLIIEQRNKLSRQRYSQ
jgi:hypothetical protein